MPTIRDTLCRLCVLSLLAGTILMGCGGPSMPKTHPLKGKVIFKGGKPVSGGSLAFESVTGEGRWFGSTVIGPDGTFTEVMTVRPDNKAAPGLVEGQHRVRIDLGRGGDPAEGGARVRLPAKYQDFDRSGLTVQVPAPNNETTFEIDPGAR